MVKELPYFMVQFDYKGEKGYGHVIEGTSEAAGGGEAAVSLCSRSAAADEEAGRGVWDD